MASITAAPPDMSNFISCIFPAGLIEIPPVSKVTALPTSRGAGPAAALVTENHQLRLHDGPLGDRGDSAPMFMLLDRVAAEDLNAIESWASATARARSARNPGVATLPGRF